MTRQPKPPSPQERTADALESLAEMFARRDREEALARREAVEERERHRIGHRSEPRRMNILTFARAVPALAEMFSRKVPSGAWAVDRDVAQVACPCKEGVPDAKLGIPVTCPGECGRVYVYDGENVRVGYPETFQPSRGLELVATEDSSNAQTSVES